SVAVVFRAQELCQMDQSLMLCMDITNTVNKYSIFSKITLQFLDSFKTIKIMLIFSFTPWLLDATRLLDATGTVSRPTSALCQPWNGSSGNGRRNASPRS